MPNALIIDDSEEIRNVIKITLEALGYQVWAGENGNEGILETKNHTFDLIITDLIMPEKEGLETIIEIRKQNRNVRIIAISGGSVCTEAGLQAAKHLGANEVLRKPFSMDELRIIVEKSKP